MAAEEVEGAYNRTSTADAATPIGGGAVDDAPPFYKNDKYYRMFVVGAAAFVMLITPVGDVPSQVRSRRCPLANAAFARPHHSSSLSPPCCPQLHFQVANAVFMGFWAGLNLAFKMSDRVRSTLPVNWPTLTWYGDCVFFVWAMLAACTTANLLRSGEGIGLKFYIGDGPFQRAETGCAFTFFIWFAQTAQLYFTRKAYAEWVGGEGQFAGLNPTSNI